MYSPLPPNRHKALWGWYRRTRLGTTSSKGSLQCTSFVTMWSLSAEAGHLGFPSIAYPSWFLKVPSSYISTTNDESMPLMTIYKGLSYMVPRWLSPHPPRCLQSSSAGVSTAQTEVVSSPGARAQLAGSSPYMILHLPAPEWS